jgi:hypothetical protein
LNFSIKSSDFNHVCGLDEHLACQITQLRRDAAVSRIQNSHKQLRATGISQSIWNNRIHLLYWSSLLSFVRGFTRLLCKARTMEYFSYSIHRQRQASAGNSDPCSSWGTNEGSCRRSRSELCLTYSSQDRRVLKPFPLICGGKKFEKNARINSKAGMP